MGGSLRTYRLRSPHGLVDGFGARAAIHAHARQRVEARVRQHEGAAVIGLEVVDLLAAEEKGPEIFA